MTVLENLASTDLLRGLDARQRRAVTHGEGPLLVVAGAGTGKTRVITRRIAWLIATKRARPSQILALTFTDRAADEMQTRVDELVPYGYVDTAVNTFHAFGDRLVREFAFELGLPSDPRVLSRADAVVLMRDRLFDLPLDYYRPLGDPTRFLDALVGFISRAKDEALSPAGLLAHAERLVEDARAQPDPDAAAEEATRLLELARAYERYQTLLAEMGGVDFGDQVMLPVRLLREHAAVRARLQERYRYILVDEFQDTNPAQVELIGLLAGRTCNVTVVGDDDQSIYAFRGAAVANILEFQERFGNARQIVLRRNYRSRAPILAASYRLIRHNDPQRLEFRQGIDKRLTAVRRTRRPVPVRERVFATLAEEADWVAGDIAARLATGTPPGEIAVLVRSNADADPFLASLDLLGLPRRFSGASGLYGCPEVRRALAFLRAVADPDSTLDIYALAAAPPYQIEGEDLARLVALARRNDRSLWSILVEVAGDGPIPPIEEPSRERVRRLVVDLRAAMEAALRRPAGQVLYEHLKRSGILARLAADPRPEAEGALLNLARFFEVVRRESGVLRDPRVPFLAHHLGALVDAGDDPASAAPDDGGDTVSVLTVHKAKGLEFRVVYLVGLVDGRFPARGRAGRLDLPEALCRAATTGAERRPTGAESRPAGTSIAVTDDSLAEERRLFYVGMTRARDELILTHSVDGGGRRARRRSPFVTEALDLLPAIASPVPAPAALAHLVGFERSEPASLSARPRTTDDSATLPVVSFSQVEEYLSCPARYRLRHVVRLPLPPHHALTYGNAMHEAVAAFGRSQMAGAPLSEDALLASLEAAWTGAGFLSRAHEEAQLAAGRQALRRYRVDALAAAVVPVGVEREFAVSVEGVRLRGRFDRVDVGPGGAVITDFKSSDVRDPARARQRARESLQLGVYALAYEAQEGRSVDALQLVFLGSGVVGRIGVEPKRLEKTRGRIAAAADGIRARRFEPTPDAVACGFCPFRDICEASAAA